MPFFVANPEFQARLRDGIPGQSIYHQPAMEGSDTSSSDDEDDLIEENYARYRFSQASYSNVHSAVKEYHHRQTEETIEAIKDFDTFASRYPPESIPKHRHVLHCCVAQTRHFVSRFESRWSSLPQERVLTANSSYYAIRGVPSDLDIFPDRIDQESLAGHEYSSLTTSIESPRGINQGETVAFGNHAGKHCTFSPGTYDGMLTTGTGRRLRSSHVIFDRNLNSSFQEARTNSERNLSPESIISNFVQWPGSARRVASPSLKKQAAGGKKSLSPKPKSRLVSAAQALVSRLKKKKSPQPEANPRATSASYVYADADSNDISYI